MQDPIDTLMAEHRIIERILDALETYAGKIQLALDPPTDHLDRFVTLLRDFADSKHHSKEEDILFVAMVEHGFPREGGPIAVMLHEHELGREKVGILARHTANAEAWTDKDRDEIIAAATGFAGLLRAHIQKEDSILYVMARRTLPPEELEKIAAKFAELEANGVANGSSERLGQLATNLIDAYAAR